ADDIDPRAIAEAIRQTTASTLINVGEELTHITVSLGVAVAPHWGGWSVRELVMQADMALYTAKRSGRNRVVVADLTAGASQPWAA
ncbi:MAG: diguanylate cyclase, partial [Dehalococcoidia bacterium]|nr:diguanylate cyclase [Dehalococcoidia bacterium]